MVIAEEAIAVVSRLTLWLVEQGYIMWRYSYGDGHIRYVLMGIYIDNVF